MELLELVPSNPPKLPFNGRKFPKDFTHLIKRSFEEKHGELHLEAIIDQTRKRKLEFHKYQIINQIVSLLGEINTIEIEEKYFRLKLSILSDEQRNYININNISNLKGRTLQPPTTPAQQKKIRLLSIQKARGVQKIKIDLVRAELWKLTANERTEIYKKNPELSKMMLKPIIDIEKSLKKEVLTVERRLENKKTKVLKLLRESHTKKK